MSQAIGSILSIMLIIALGAILARRGWFSEASTSMMARLVVTISLPAMMISSLMKELDRDMLIAFGYGALIPFGLIAVMYVLSYPVSALFRVPAGRRGIFRAAFAFSNSMFLGMPVNLAIFGSQAVPFVLLYYFANTTLFWTVGVYGIKRDAPGRHPPLFSPEAFRNIVSPTLLAVIAAVTIKLAGWPLPGFFLDACRILGAMTTPMSMLFIGTVIASLDRRRIRIDRTMVFLILARFILLPAAMIAAVHALPLPQMMKQVFVIEAAMPVMTQTAITARAYGSDGEYASLLITVTTSLSIIVIPLYMLLFTVFPQLVGPR